LDDLNAHYLGELIDDYILSKLDARRAKIFEEHLPSCERCRKDLATMHVFIKGVKDLSDNMQ
jgi:anti-sigma factor RsiW